MSLDDFFNVFFKPGGERHNEITGVANLVEIDEHKVFEDVLGEGG